ncbi:D-serine ammonia-lyase [Aneurinibacillus thermoaerophilus]|uniref:D-serine ammonia-lyase n=1 Tax=Aneurinibacillus thermoaerophilus TaxID=143495 RepID=UPI002E1AF631|nr:D-serine ammonia-lyase [Aneurinibacillus thermoaerophilus]MED0758949.1 D-serine ammonia-lyase [Aneurinibacillus thermoaerophilus]MED0761025.1 D-serine ammonia-lyase [Aneurinibacillus thermoaerophilus]
MKKLVMGKPIEQWKCEINLLNKLVSLYEVFWKNPNHTSVEEAMSGCFLTIEDVKEAEARLHRFRSYIQHVFPETRGQNGMIESPLVEISRMKQAVEQFYGLDIPGRFFLKLDSHLPISGSIKARGGIYEVLKHAEELAVKHRLLSLEDDYSKLDSESFRKFFSQFSIAVGSTGNLGLSIGIISAKLGFQVTVHMSQDAKQWKKDLLRKHGVTVVEYQEDYSKAVEEGRKQALQDPTCYFIDDENSRHLFLGYAVAALRLQKQLENMNIKIDEDHPLFVYLPCGVGGGPGGVAFGLKMIYEDNVHCFFAEPTHSPCMLLGLVTGFHDQVSVQDFGIDNKTIADGLAVGRPSRFVGKLMEPLLSGSYTVSDEQLYRLLSMMIDEENIHLEPSALAGVYGPVSLIRKGQDYIHQQKLKDKIKNATHIMWATGGSMVPRDIIRQDYKKGKELLINWQ